MRGDIRGGHTIAFGGVATDDVRRAPEITPSLSTRGLDSTQAKAGREHRTRGSVFFAVSPDWPVPSSASTGKVRVSFDAQTGVSRPDG